jgi:hypothetical protein
MKNGELTRSLEDSSLVQSDVIGLVTLDFVLRLIFCRVMNVAFVIHFLAMDLDDLAANAARVGVPPHVASHSEFLRHG